ncbi:hypothetical protein EDB89DRAFT_1970253 [Lactarius sanguifluus]|nr:hypothetical protein EDB89DRAFT_1970253 [Lactarius sanguifluus]
MTATLCALDPVASEEGHPIVLPSLRHLRVENRRAMDVPSWDALLSFITLRSRSGLPVQVNVPFRQCHICHAGFREKKGLNRHLADKHGYRILCSYCRDFECKPGHNDLFRKHLRREHPEARRKDARIRNSSLTILQLETLVAQHAQFSARARHRRTVEPSTTATAPHSE